MHDIDNKLKIRDKIQRESARRCMSHWGEIHIAAKSTRALITVFCYWIKIQQFFRHTH